MANEIYPDEQALIDKLYSLICYLYRKKLAGEIITAFEESLAAKAERAERLGSSSTGSIFIKPTSTQDDAPPKSNRSGTDDTLLGLRLPIVSPASFVGHRHARRKSGHGAVVRELPRTAPPDV
jgi:hypothetical protein